MRVANSKARAEEQEKMMKMKTEGQERMIKAAAVLRTEERNEDRKREEQMDLTWDIRMKNMINTMIRNNNLHLQAPVQHVTLTIRRNPSGTSPSAQNATETSSWP